MALSASSAAPLPVAPGFHVANPASQLPPEPPIGWLRIISGSSVTGRQERMVPQLDENGGFHPQQVHRRVSRQDIFERVENLEQPVPAMNRPQTDAVDTDKRRPLSNSE